MQRQQGAILMIALMFLVTITLLTLSSMRSSNIGLHLAQNEESRVAAGQAAQALIDAIVASPSSTPVVGVTGYSACTPGETGCDRNDLSIPNPTLAAEVTANHLQARVDRVGTLFRPPPRAVETSIDKFSSASFRIVTTYDRIDDGLGREQITGGVLVLVPKQ
jgi:Tfp pilus assembly protein PilX